MNKALRARNWWLGLTLTLAAGVIPGAIAGQRALAVDAKVDAKVDAIFARWTASTPGCVVGVATNGTPVLAKGYGMADLEHDVRLSPDSILEPGSVAKQFTAAAVLVLARDGKLSLDDQVTTYIPELPGYGSPLTIRQMLNHTSGLRDWGNVAGIAGWARTTRVHTHAHVLDIVSRQRALNFTPGTQWSYSNTGFNLAAIIVQRVSGMPFPEFTRTRLFEPLGMAHTSWRDDYTRVVKGRALAYSERDGAYHTNMPFENVYGNGGLLTTIGDLLKWNEHYDAPQVADAAIIAEQQNAGRFNDGRAHGYGLGLFVGTYKGLREISHSGSTAGYQAFLTRFPDQRVSVAVLCNSSGAQATQYAHAVADAYLGDRLKPAPVTATHTLTGAEADRFVGVWVSDTTGVPVTIARGKDGLVLARSVALHAQSPMRVLTDSGDALELDARGLRHTDAFGTVEELGRAQPAAYTDEQLAALAGTYTSDEAETVLTAVVENHALVLKRRPDTTIKLTPVSAGTFAADHGLGTVIFRHDATGTATELTVVEDRVWDLRFTKVRSKT